MSLGIGGIVKFLFLFFEPCYVLRLSCVKATGLRSRVYSRKAPPSRMPTIPYNYNYNYPQRRLNSSSSLRAHFTIENMFYHGREPAFVPPWWHANDQARLNRGSQTSNIILCTFKSDTSIKTVPKIFQQPFFVTNMRILGTKTVKNWSKNISHISNGWRSNIMSLYVHDFLNKFGPRHFDRCFQFRYMVVFIWIFYCCINANGTIKYELSHKYTYMHGRKQVQEKKRLGAVNIL